MASSSIESLQDDLRQQLELMSLLPSSTREAEDAKWVLKKDAIAKFVESGIHAKATLDELKDCLKQLQIKYLVLSNEAYNYAYNELVSAISKANANAAPSQVEDVSDHQEMPLFCEDSVYHASLCCYAVTTRNKSNYKEFFSTHAHQFEEVSFSCDNDHSNVERYIIARKGKTYFIGFLSEPDFLQWPKRYNTKTFSDGIAVQLSKIPLRFFIQELYNQYRIIFTGFSFGGLLAQSLVTSIWKQECISTSILEKNLCCICLSPPFINLNINQGFSNEIKSTFHSIVVEDDFIPPITNFLDPKCTVHFKEFQKLISEKDIQFSDLPNLMGSLQDIYKCEGQNSDAAESTLKLTRELLKKSWKVLAEKENLLLGFIYLIEKNGLIWTQIRNERLRELTILKKDEIDSVTIQCLFQNDAKSYHEKILNSSFVKMPLEKLSFDLPELRILQPEIESVSFHRYGKEFAIAITGNNFWFTSEVRVCSPFQCIPAEDSSQKSVHQCIPAKDSSQKSLQFNRTEERVKHCIDTTSDFVRVEIYSHFSELVVNDKVQVKRKEFDLSYRQEQLAMLTPSKLIEAGYLSALLEQLPHTKPQFSHRFDIIRKFFERVVNVVPIESLVHAVSVADDLNIAIKCCRQLMRLDESLSASRTMHTSLKNAVNRMVLEEIKKHPSSKESTRARSKSLLIRHKDDFYTFLPKQCCVDSLYGLCLKKIILSDSSLYHEEFKFLQRKTLKVIDAGKEAVCGKDLSCVYSVSPNKSPDLLSSPLQILREGRKKVRELVESSLEKKNEGSLTNNEMLDTVNEIRHTEVKLCSLLLGAFMEEQIRVPMTKKKGDLAAPMAAVGVWAILSNAKGFIESNPSRPVWVEVKDHIKSAFIDDPEKVKETNGAEATDGKYAAKLQFMVQVMEEIVSCNSHYVSYSLERQLIDLCKKIKIEESTPLKTLTGDWDRLFKGSVMSYIIPNYRSLIARWLKWSLMIHHLREELACYSTVGVIGLVNSGKSLLVSKLFDIQIPVGTIGMNRTTVPFLYNLHGVVDGLDVIDFPGVDDRDERIPDLAKLLLDIAQVVVFVVDYRKAHTKAAKEWLEVMQDKSVPLLVCLTHADKLYAECMNVDGSHPELSKVKKKIDKEREILKKNLGSVLSHTMHYFSFCQDNDSNLNNDDGRKKLLAAGIKTTTEEVGDWLADTFEGNLGQKQLAVKLRTFIHKKPV